MKENELRNLLTDLISLPKENEYVEFKINNSNPELIGKYISGLSNSANLAKEKFGYLVFGIEDETHKVVGTNFKPSQTKHNTEELQFWLSRMLAPRIDFDIYEIEYLGQNVSLFRVTATLNQPVFFQQNAYIRIGSILQPLRDYPEKERRLWQNPSSEFELEIAKENVVTDDLFNLLNTEDIFSMLIGQPYPTTKETVIDRLIKEKLITNNNGNYDITNLGALLFANNLSDFDLDRKAIRVTKYKGKSKLYIEKDQMGRYGYGGSFEKLIHYILDLLPSSEVIGVALREIKMYPPKAVRELVANAIVHQDLRDKTTSLSVEIYDDRIEINNAGLPLIDTNRFIDESSTRNNVLANAMRKMKICEDKGSGIDRVIILCEEAHLPAPDFRANNNQTIAILYAHESFNQMDKKAKIRATYQHCCLMHITNQKMTNHSLRKRFEIEEHNHSIASRLIRETAVAKLIKVGDTENKSKKNTYYIPFWG